MRALLVYNPNATTTRPDVIDDVTRLLASRLELEVVSTKRRDHAGFIAAGAADSGIDVVTVFGGDGTVNEVVQGLASTGVPLAVIPGGSTNVFARALGLPNDPMRAAAAALDLLAARRSRTISLGQVAGRLFTFNAGFGFDAEVVRRVEQRHVLKRTVRQASFFYAGVDTLVRRHDHRRARIEVAVDGDRVTELVGSVLVCNTRPFTYLGRFPVDLCPGGSLDAGLGLTTLAAVTTPLVLRLVATTLRGQPVERIRGVTTWSDVAAIDLTCDEAVPLQVDGDHLGDHTAVRLETVPDALVVVAEPGGDASGS